MSVHERIYRVLLMAYPAEHRDAYGEPMTQLLRDRIRDEGGGVRTALVWADVIADLARSALIERTETTMDTIKTGWWRFAAGLVASVLAIGAVGVLAEPGPGPWYTTVSGGAALILGPILIVAGLLVRHRNTIRGNLMIAVGVLPGVAATVLFWFPPALAFGLLSTSVLIAAVADAGHRQNAQRVPGRPLV